MPGDLFRVNKDVCIKKGTIVRVVSVDTTNKFPEKGLEGSAGCVDITDCINNGGVWVAFLDPIPLTAEILNKNGFIATPLIDLGIEYCSEVYKLNVVCRRNDEGWTIYANHFGFDKKDLYVHELQHALRLCGIDKTIEII